MSEIYLIACSMLTPLGHSSKTVHCSLEAGINRYQETDILSACGHPIRMALVPPSVIKKVARGSTQAINSRQRRLLNLAHTALLDLKPVLPSRPLPIFMAGPETYTPDCGVSRPWFEYLAKACDVQLDVANSRFSNIGRAGTMDMLDIATRYFEATQAPYALVGGVDSFYHVGTLDYLEGQKRLLLPTSVSGFIPGEGCAFLLLASPFAPEQKRESCLARLGCPAIGFERLSLNDMGESQDGLAKVFNQMDDCKPGIETLYSSENGEPHFSKELAIAITRNRAIFSEHKKVIRPAECFGDVGAAFGAIAIGLAAQCLTQKNNGVPIIVASASDSGARGVLSVSSAQPSPQMNTASSKSKKAYPRSL